MTQPAATPAKPKAEPNASSDAPRTLRGLGWVMVTRGSPRILILLVLLAASYRLWLGQWSWRDLIPPVALALWWPFQEWLIHTYVLHFRPRQIGPFTLDFAQARKHRRHHLKPWDFSDLSIPLHTYLYAVPALALLGYLGRDLPALWTGILCFVTFGLHYEWCHFMAHSNYVPKTALYKAIWRNHRLHHFKNETLWMGVSSRLGDRVLGTCPDQKSVERSATCRTLGIGSPA